MDSMWPIFFVLPMLLFVFMISANQNRDAVRRPSKRSIIAGIAVLAVIGAIEILVVVFVRRPAATRPPHVVEMPELKVPAKYAPQPPIVDHE